MEDLGNHLVPSQELAVDEVAAQEVEALGRALLVHWLEILVDLQVAERDPMVQGMTSLVWNE